jgi:NCS1 family nucleobase:cation symporter-1
LLSTFRTSRGTQKASNIVSPANDFSNLYPKRIGFKAGGVITCLIGLLMQPWKLLATHGSFIVGWLVGYSSFLGPVAGILIADYFLLRGTELNVDDLYRREGRYEYSRGVNPRALVALAIGIFACLVGLVVKPYAAAEYGPGVSFLARFLYAAYDYAWFVGFGSSMVIYVALMRRHRTIRSVHGWRRFLC